MDGLMGSARNWSVGANIQGGIGWKVDGGVAIAISLNGLNPNTLQSWMAQTDTQRNRFRQQASQAGIVTPSGVPLR